MDHYNPRTSIGWRRRGMESRRSDDGVIGSDFRGPQEIGSAQFERDSNNALIPDWLNFWYPNKQPNDHRSIVYFKRTLTGLITDKITKNWSGLVIEADGGYRKISGTYELSDVPHIAKFPERIPTST